MDDIVAEQYRKLMQAGFVHAGSIENPTMFIDSQVEGISICDQATRDYMNLYVMVSDGIITDLKYLCVCNPIANVVVEYLCDMVIGKPLEEAKKVSKEDFFQAIGSDGGGVRRKVWGIIDLLKVIINRYENRAA